MNSLEKIFQGIMKSLMWTPADGGIICPISVNIEALGNGSVKVDGPISKNATEALRCALLAFEKIISKEMRFPLSSCNTHIKFPAPVEGVSFGLALVLAMYCAMKEIPGYLDLDIGVTGEVSDKGNVFAVEKVQEKIEAAKGVGLARVIIPHGNWIQLDHVHGIRVHPVHNLKEAISCLFL